VLGRNGVGKTTLLATIMGHTRLRRGRLAWEGRDLARLPVHRRARGGIGYVPQEREIFPSLTVEENLLVGAENRRRNGIIAGLVGLPDPRGRDVGATVDRISNQLGLDAYRHAAAATLPTGRLRLVELGRALCLQPSVLLLDEPASGLDDDETEELHLVLRGLADGGLALLLVEHDLSFVRDTATVVHAMAAGRVVASGPPAAIEADATVRSIEGDEP